MKSVSFKSATVFALEIPFVEAFRHSTKSRNSSGSIVLKLETARGTVGWGEGMPRYYVSGETVESTVAHIRTALWPVLSSLDLAGHEPSSLLDDVEDLLPDDQAGEVLANHSARCAVELAVLDCVLKENGISLQDCLPPVKTSVIYSGIITSGSPAKVEEHARMLRRVGITHIKIKVGEEHDVERLKIARDVLGADAALRVDANGVWSLEEATAKLAAMEPFGIGAVEEPLGRERVADLPELRRRTSIPIMVDESLVTLEDADRLIQEEACDIFNVRVSKCGGIARSREFTRIAKNAGLRTQLGAHVGESAILSAAGRHLAAHLDEFEFVEGSFGTLLLTEDLSKVSIRFGHGGRGLLLKGPGIGVKIEEDRVRKYAVKTFVMTK